MQRIKSAYDTVIQDGVLCPLQQMTPVPSDVSVVYEVIRVMAGVPLFMEAHLERLNRSVHLAGLSESLDLKRIKGTIHALTEECGVEDQNIRLNVWQEHGHIRWTGFFMESHYPDPELYQAGVATGLLRMARHNPTAKVWQADLKAAVTHQCEVRQLYEMILVDSEGFISEGSRSNLFFTQGNTLVTAPDEAVLGGITRLKLLELISELNLPLVKRPIAAAELEAFDGAFLTGTSIHLLPVRTIDAWQRQSSAQHLIRLLMDRFEEAVQSYEKAYTYD